MALPMKVSETMRYLTGNSWSIGTCPEPLTSHRVASGRTRDTSSSRNAPDFMNTAKCPPPSIGTNAFAGARMDSTNERARLVGG